MDDAPQSPDKSPPSVRPNWERTIFWMFLLVLVFGSGLYVFKSLKDLPGDTVTGAVNNTVHVVTNLTKSLADLAASFSSGTVTVSVHSTGTELDNTSYFQFKRIKQTELFTHTDHAVTGFGYIPLPDVVVEARAPVEYTYYLDLEADWRLEVREQMVNVYTPKVRFNKPSVDISRIQYDVKKDSVLRDATEARENLKSSITSLSVLKAQENLGLVRDTGRQPIEDFVRRWLVNNFSDGTNYDVRILFPGEAPPDHASVTRDEGF